MNDNHGNIFHGEVSIQGDRNAIVSGSGNAVGEGAAAGGTECFAELERLIARHEHELPDPEAARSSAAALRREAESDTPDRGLRRALLTALTAAAGPVTAVAESVLKVRQALDL